MRAVHQLLQSRTFFGCAVALILLGCKNPPSSVPPKGPLPVNAITAVERDVTAWDEFTGRMEAVDAVEIRSRVSGYLTEVHFKAGDIVEKGVPLFTIDPRPYQADLDRASAMLEQVEAQLKLAQVEFDRAKGLINSQAISAQDLDQKAAALQQAKAGVSAAKAAKEAAALSLGFTRIESPIAGRLSDVRVTVGNLVQSTGGAEGVLTTIISIDSLYAYVDADENAVLRFMELRAQGKRKSVRDEKVPAFVQLGNEKGFPHEGYLDFVDNRLDPTTGTLRVRGVFKSWDPLLMPGFFVRMRVSGGPPSPTVLIPDEVISSQQGVKFVYVVRSDKTLERRNLEIGTLDEGLRVVRSGLKAGDQVVSTRLQMLRPGMLVEPSQPPAIAPAEAGK